MEIEKYRHEFKYIASDSALRMLEARLTGLLRRDSHSDASGKYRIRSIYFDDYDNRCLQENISGTEPREKYRIRIYNEDPSFISLELKKRIHGKIGKNSETLSKDLYDYFVKGKSCSFQPETQPLSAKLSVLKQTALMQPKVIVQYERTPFTCPLGNVRITFDRKLASSNRFDLFFERDICARPVLPSNMALLEVKFDAFLPDYIRDALNNASLNLTTFSKYYLCRKFCL